MRGFLLLLLGATVSGLTMLLARLPGVVERVYGAGVGPWISKGLSRITGWSPVSVSWLALLALTGWALVRLVDGVSRWRAGSLPLGRGLAGGASWAAGVIGALLVVFYVAWGLNYARAPVDERLGLVTSEAPDPEALRQLTEYAVERTNEAYRRLHDGSDDVGTPTVAAFDPVAASTALEVGWRRVGPAIGMGSAEVGRYGPVKTVGATWLLDALDLSGVYSPFTGEAHVSGSLPSVVLPATAGHEQAHQRGIARENEATFAGVLAAIHSDDAFTRYSGWARVVRALQGDMIRVDRQGWDEIVARLVPGAVRDWEDYVQWYRDNRSIAAPVATAVNDTYLRAHGVPGGVLSYGRVTTLLLAWAARNDGRLTYLPALREGA